MGEYPTDLQGIRPKDMTNEQLRRVPHWPVNKQNVIGSGVSGDDLLGYSDDEDGNWWYVGWGL